MQYTSEYLSNQEPALLDQVRTKTRLKHYSISNEQAHTDWIKRFILHIGKKHPRDMGSAEVEQFITHLSVNSKIAASTQNQAKAALLFLYPEELGIELPWLQHVEQAKVLLRLPVVLTVNETRQILDKLNGIYKLLGYLAYGTGMRLMEVMRLRIKDIDLERKEILVRDGKGSKDRVTMLP